MDDASGDAIGLSGSLGRLASSLRDVIAPAQVAQGRLDETGDEAAQAGRKAALASAGFSTLSISTRGAAVSVGVLGGAMMASLIPALVTLGTVLAPLAVVLGGVAVAAGSLAAAFATVIGTGFLAWGNKLAKQNKQKLADINKEIARLESLKQTQDGLTASQKQHLAQLKKEKKAVEGKTTAIGALAAELGKVKDEIAAALIPLGQQFIPLVRDAVRALPQLVRNIVAAIGPLDSFKTELRRLGGIAMEVIPQIVAGMFDIARTALPPFRKFIDYLRSEGPGAFNILKRTFNEAYPIVQRLGSAFVGILPGLLKFGTTVLQVVAPALETALNYASRAIEWFNSLSESTRKLAVTGVLLAPAIAKVGMALVGLTGPIGLVVGGIALLWAAWSRNLGNIQGKTKNVLNTVNQAFGGLGQTLKTRGKQALQGFIDGFNVLTQRAMTVASNVVDAVMREFREGGPELKTNLKRYVEIVTDNFNRIKEMVLGAMNFIWKNAIKPALNAISKLWDQHGAEIMVGASQLMNFLAGTVNAGLRVVQGFWNAFGDEIMTVTRYTFDIVGALIGTALDLLITTFTAFTDLLTGDWRGFLEKFHGLGERIFDGVLRFIKKWGGRLLSYITGMSDGLLKVFYQFGQDLIFGSLIPRILQSILDAFTNWGLIKTVKGILDDIWEDVKTFAIDTLEKFKTLINDTVSWLESTGKSMMGGAFEALADAAISAYNDTMPDTISIPSVTVGGGGIDIPSISVAGQTIGGGSLNIPSVTVGGGSFNVPQLDTGGFIEGDGLAMLHAGEEVVPKAEVDRRQGGDGGDTYVEVRFEGDVYDEGSLTSRIVDAIERKDDQKARRAKRGAPSQF